MRKYYIGLIVLTLLTVGLTIYVVNLGLSGKQDKQTQKRAQEIADQLNSYVDSDTTIPENLEEAGIHDVPDTISYKKISTDKYEFCVTYAQANSGYGAQSVSDVVAQTAYGQMYSTALYPDESDKGERSYLYISTTYKKGQNCQTIKPYFLNASPSTNYNESMEDSMNQLCDPSGQYYQYYKDYCETNAQQD